MFPAGTGTKPFQAHLVGISDRNKALLTHYSVDTHALGSTQMQQRGQACKDCYLSFGSTLRQNAYLFARPTAPPAGADMSTLQHSSPRLPPGEDTFTLQTKKGKSIFTLDGTAAGLTPSDALDC